MIRRDVFSGVSLLIFCHGFRKPPCPPTVLIEAVISVLSAFYDFGRKGYWASEVLQPEIDDADDRYELLMEGISEAEAAAADSED